MKIFGTFHIKAIQALILIAVTYSSLSAQTILNNVPGRTTHSLNGKWNYIIDPLDAGNDSWIALWKDKKPTGKLDFL